ncbi:MAG: glycosyltransferase [Terrimicrobiaceae bacterium]|nr:glycosyltransferase [Terrimicrobiaceae bacterium]
MTSLDLERLPHSVRESSGPILVVAGAGSISPVWRELASAGVREVYVLTGSVPAARAALAEVGEAENRPVVAPLSLEDFLREVPICPSWIWFAERPRGDRLEKALRAAAEYGAIGTRIAGLDGSAMPDATDFRGSDGGEIELTRVNGRRPAGLGAEPFARTASLLAAAFAGDGTDDGLRRAVEEILGETRREAVRGQGDLRAWPRAPVSDCLPSAMPDGQPWPRVSVITASFQQGRYIEENILSVLRQNYPDIEHIICDGGSSDGTVAILKRYDAHLASWVSEPDKGQSDALNKGFRQATGEIVTWLNSDDMLAPGALAAAVVALVTSGADMVAGVAEVRQDGRVESRHLTSCRDGLLPLEDLLNLDDCWLRGQFFYQPEVLFTRGIWERAGSRVREDLHFSMDYELWLRMALAGARLVVIGAPIALFRKHDEQKTFLTQNYEPELRGLRDAFASGNGLAVPQPSPVEETRRLKIVFFNDNGFRFGAGIGHRRLVEALQLGGHVVTCLCAKDVLRPADPLSPIQLADVLLAGDPDVVFFGNLHGANLGEEVVSLVSERCPAIFFMHDYWLITGRCAYMQGCEKFLAGCDAACPTPTEYPALAPEKIHAAWAAKRLLHFGGTPVRIATNSRAVADVADAYLARQGAAQRAAVVNLPLPLGSLQPLDRLTCRRMLGIPGDAFLVLFSAGRLDDPRKGVDLLLEAIELAGIPNLLLGCLGREESAAQFPRENLRCFGYVNDPESLARIYSASDVYVGPSRDETFGQVFTEAAACGTPSIGFRTGGVSEAVLDGWTGIVADEISAQRLAGAILEIWSNAATAASFSGLAPVIARNRFAPEKTLNQLHRLLGDALAGRGRRLGRKIVLPVAKPAEPAVARVHQGFVRWGSGFDRFEPATRRGRAMKCSWVYGPKAEFDLTVERGGRYHLLILYTCPLKQQALSVRNGARFLGEFELNFSPNDLRTVEIPIFGSVGTQRITLYPRQRAHHQAAAPERAAFRLFGMALVPRAE